MCVIMIVDGERPTRTMIEKAADWNDHGMGIAYREDGEVVWRKGIDDVEEVIGLAETLPIPYVLHFRIASSGGKRRELNHPFPVDKRTSLALTGRTKGYVLFHNGDWKEWEPMARSAAVQSNTRIPTGKWSDTRAMAWLCSIYGLGFMEFLPTQRGVAFSPDDIEVFTGNGWTQINGVWCSNDIFMQKGNAASTNAWTICSFDNCQRRDIDKHYRCPEHPWVGVQQETMKQATGNGTSGVAQNAPFHQSGAGSKKTEASSERLISLSLAERWNREGHLSNNKFKAVKRAFEQIELGGIHKTAALVRLGKITKIILDEREARIQAQASQRKR